MHDSGVGSGFAALQGSGFVPFRLDTMQGWRFLGFGTVAVTIAGKDDDNNNDDDGVLGSSSWSNILKTILKGQDER